MRGFLVGVALTACSTASTHPDDTVTHGDAGTTDASSAVASRVVPDASASSGVGSPPSDAIPSPLRLCSWNLKKLGHGDAKDYPTIAAILDSECDAAVVIEVMQKGGTHPGYDALLDALGRSWSGLVTDRPRPNTTSGNSEFYAVVWRASALDTCEGWDDLRYVTDDDGAIVGADMDFFSREPAYACFALVTPAGEVDFLLGAYHAIWGDGKEATIAAEVEHLDSAVDEMMTPLPGERDALLLGDFNIAPARLAELSTLTDWTEGTGSTLNSTGARTQNLYDHLLVWDPSATPELGPQAEVLDVRHWAASDEAFFDTVSDHLPIRVVLTPSSPDDD